MARESDEAPRIDRHAQKPLLQGHLKPGGVRPGGITNDAPQPQPAADRSAQPAEDVSASANDDDAARGKATKSPANVATRPHLEGAEQGPK